MLGSAPAPKLNGGVHEGGAGSVAALAEVYPRHSCRQQGNRNQTMHRTWHVTPDQARPDREGRRRATAFHALAPGVCIGAPGENLPSSGHLAPAAWFSRARR